MLHDSPAGLQLKEVAEKTAINKSTAYRVLAHLEHKGYVFRDSAGAYAIGVRLARLGSGASYQTTMRKISRPVLEELARITGETVSLAVLEGREVLLFGRDGERAYVSSGVPDWDAPSALLHRIGQGDACLLS